jgi:hypothetical protein
MLSGVQQHFAMPLPKGTADRRRFDELRPRTDDGEDDQRLTVSPPQARRRLVCSAVRTLSSPR